jgi:hypothetical protein
MQAFQIDHGGPPESFRPAAILCEMPRREAAKQDDNESQPIIVIRGRGSLRLATKSAGTVKLFPPEHRGAALAGVSYGRNVHGSLVNFDHWIMDAGGTSADCWPSKDETSFPYQ